MNYCFVFGHEPWLLPPALEMIDVIKKNGHGVDVIYAEYLGDGVPEGDYNPTYTFGIVKKGSRKAHYLKHLYLRSYLKELIKQKPVDVIIACDMISLHALVLTNTKIKRGYWCFERYYSLRNFLSLDYFRNKREKAWIKSLDFFLIPSESRRDNLIADYRLNMPSAVIYNCKQLRTGTGKTNPAFDFSQYKHTLIYAGRISPTQLVDEIVDAMEFVQEGVGLILAGPGDPTYLSQLVEKIETNTTLKKRVVFLGRVSREEVYQLIDIADAGFVLYDEIIPEHPSDPAPNKIGDYISGNTWLIGTDQKYIHYWLEQRGAGVCVKKADKHSLAAAINTIMTDARFSDRTLLSNLYKNELNMDKQFDKLNALMAQL